MEETYSGGISDDTSVDWIRDFIGVIGTGEISITPLRGSLKGGDPFLISLTEEFPDDVRTAVVEFKGGYIIDNATVLNPFTLSGTVPPFPFPQTVIVEVRCRTGLLLGRTVFEYFDEVSDMLPVLSSFATPLYPPPVASASYDTQVLGPLNIQGQACASGPPEVSVTLLKNQNLPGKSELLDEDQIPIDILLLTVEDCEFLGCLSFLNPSFRKFYGGSDLGFVYLGDTGEDQSKLKIAVMKCHRGSITQGGSSVSVMDAVDVLRPKAVFSVGFCGGLDSTKVKPGDVVVSEKLITYSPSIVTRDGIKETGVEVPLKSRLLGLIQYAGDGWSAPLKNPKKQEEVKIYCGAFLSGPEVIEDNKQCIVLRSRFPEALAVEMEGEGLYAAAHKRDVEWIIIKGVSEYAGDSTSDKTAWREFASLMAASLTAHILSDTSVFQDWPHYKSAKKRKMPSD